MLSLNNYIGKRENIEKIEYIARSLKRYDKSLCNDEDISFVISGGYLYNEMHNNNKGDIDIYFKTQEDYYKMISYVQGYKNRFKEVSKHDEYGAITYTYYDVFRRKDINLIGFNFLSLNVNTKEEILNHFTNIFDYVHTCWFYQSMNYHKFGLGNGSLFVSEPILKAILHKKLIPLSYERMKKRSLKNKEKRLAKLIWERQFSIDSKIMEKIGIHKTAQELKDLYIAS